jgi:protein involved in polysaccharide export with SLBB domain
VSKLVEYMPTPEVSVIVRELHGNTIAVAREVRQAGRYEISQRETVLDAADHAADANRIPRGTTCT